MKSILLGLMVANLSYAGEPVILSPGETRIILAGTETTVVCRYPENTLVEKFCNCAYMGPNHWTYFEVHYIYTSGDVKKVTLGRYADPNGCQAALEKHPTCQK